MTDAILLEERQYMGFNKHSVLWRTILALFCFVAYYWSENPKPVDVSVIHIGSYPVQDIENSGQLFFVMGLFILIISAALVFILHIKTTITENSIILDGLWTARKVKIDLNSIIAVDKTKYSKYLLNRPVYNLHLNGTIRFYSSGNDAILLTDRDGLKYKIGTQKQNDFYTIIKNNIDKNSSKA